MITITGKYNSADVYVSGYEDVDQATYSQLVQLLSVPCMAGQHIAIMPDCHAGKACCIGYTQTITDSVVPNLVGVDVSCGMHVVKISKDYHFDFAKLDKIIRQYIPCGTGHRKTIHPFAEQVEFDRLVADVDANNLKLSVGSLGSGNHYNEVDIDSDGNYYIVIHSGSRHLGVEVCNFHQKRAIQQRHNAIDGKREEFIETLKAAGRTDEIEHELAEYDRRNPVVPDALAWLDGSYLDDYLNDMNICTQFADMNRRAMMDIILDKMDIKRRYIMDSFTTVHNYVDVANKIIRKGAISLQSDEIAIIPMNMRDGALLVRGKGNAATNFSGPHGAGRLLSRSAAKETLAMSDFKKSMEGIYTTSVNAGTIDESPMAYKPMQAILDNIGDMCDVVKIIKPVYNFKAS